MTNEFQERIGVGQTHYGLARTGPTRERKVIDEEGPNRGRTAAIQTDHADGRIDATVFPEPVRVRMSMSQPRLAADGVATPAPVRARAKGGN